MVLLIATMSGMKTKQLVNTGFFVLHFGEKK